MRLFIDGLAGLVFLFQGRPQHTLAIIKAHFSFYQLLPKFLVKRKKWKSRLKYAEFHQYSTQDSSEISVISISYKGIFGLYNLCINYY